MRLLVGVAVADEVVEMTLPADVPLAHLLPEIRAVIAARIGDPYPARMPRRVDGRWFDLESSLDRQGCASGSLICLEERDVADRMPHHDPVVEIAQRGPPVDLVPDGAVIVVLGAVVGILLALLLGDAAVLAVAAAPLLWSVLPLVGGVAPSAGTRGWLRVASAAAGAAAVAASGPVAASGAAGVMLDGCVACLVVAHVARRRSAAALLRVALGAVEWFLLAATLPLATVAGGWSGW